MAYNILVWKDHAVAPANTYTVTENDDGTITLTPAGEIIQQGTNMSAVNFNNMETGIFAANLGAAEALQLLRLVKDKTDSLRELSSKIRLPIRRSTRLTTAQRPLRSEMKMSVTIRIIRSLWKQRLRTALLATLLLPTKMLNGFKLAYTGSASSVNVKCYVQGGK